MIIIIKARKVFDSFVELSLEQSVSIRPGFFVFQEGELAWKKNPSSMVIYHFWGTPKGFEIHDPNRKS
ncbi:hypothetical protein GMMP15_1260003 [Candidatus Magnetomoraceae bacterium gMMP-15]